MASFVDTAGPQGVARRCGQDWVRCCWLRCWCAISVMSTNLHLGCATMAFPAWVCCAARRCTKTDTLYADAASVDISYRT